MIQSRKVLTKKIGLSDLFIVIATRNYLDALRNLDGDIITQIDLAHNLKKPFFIVIDSILTLEEKNEIKEYFSKYYIIKEIEIDINNKGSINKAILEIRNVAKKFGDIDEIEVITPYTREDRYL